MTSFARFARVVLLVNLAVIAWGAYVRASGSGAGCGAHWPLCNGVVVPHAPATATVIEFAHRATSGVALLLVVALAWRARRAAPPGDPVRAMALASLALMLTEALLGAGLVLFRLVAHDASLARALSLAAHLVNTFLLLGALTLTAWFAGGAPPVSLRGQRVAVPVLAAALLGVLAVGMSGAVSALGDTLFPAGSLGEGLRLDTSPTAHLLLRIRVLHPTLAVAVGCGLIPAALLLAVGERSRMTMRLARATVALVVLQWALGMVNLLLLAPIWLQLVHLLVADLLWITLVALGASVLRVPAPAPASRPARAVAIAAA